MTLQNKPLEEISKHFCWSAEANAPTTTLGFLLERSFGKWMHRVAGSLPRRLTRRFRVVPGALLHSCEQTHCTEGRACRAPGGDPGARRPLRVTASPSRVPRCPSCLLPGLQSTLPQLGYHVNNEELSYCRTEMWLNEIKMQRQKTTTKNQETEHCG